MHKESLNGVWQYRIGAGEETTVQVPFSALPVGHSQCKRYFDLSENSERVLLQFDGITYAARVSLNGKYLGDMLPYSEYIWDITDTVKPKDNLLTVDLEDITPAFGPSEGWENYGGIIRDVSLLYAAKNCITDVFFHAELIDNYTAAQYVVETTSDGEQKGEYVVTLSLDGVAVDEFSFSVGTPAPLRTIKNVRLWSPDEPCLYDIKVCLLVDGEQADVYTHKVGFREFKCDRHRFLLNGQPIFLLGVCRHEMYGDYGHTVPEELIEKDLRMIKEAGCNFVRLVHYPHNKKTLEIADRLGLMVSEEPGLWWSDLSDPKVSKGSLEVLRRTVLRDRNHPSIVFWFCFNECKFTAQFLQDAAQVCRKLDTTRPVSGANCMSNEDTLLYCNKCGFDFYTMHPYSETPTRALESARILHDKPLLFSEWGGYYVYDNPHLLSDFIHVFYNLYRQNNDNGGLAGALFWYWAEVRDYNRERPACIDGVLTEALVDVQRQPTMIFDTFCKAWKQAAIVEKPTDLYAYEPLDMLQKTPFTCCDDNGFEAFLSRCGTVLKPSLARMRKRRITVGPVLQKQEVAGMVKTPYVLSDNTTLTFEGDISTDTVTVLGAVSAPKGYPLGGEYGEAAAEVIVQYDNAEERFTLRNGWEFTAAFTVVGSSRIEPHAVCARPFARFSYDKNFENYLINRLDLKLSDRKAVKRITLRSLNRGYDMLIYGIFG